MSEVAIKVENLSKCYQIYDKPYDRLLQMLVRGRKQYFHEFWALRDVSFEVKKGETVGIIGYNGAGKSTLLKIISETTQPSTGSVFINGRIAALLELGMGFHPDFTGRQNAVMAGQLLGLQTTEIDLLMPQIEAFSEIGNYIDQPVRMYSSGMQVRLAFAVATAIRPDILIVDEALSVGDAYFQHKCFSRIRQFQEQGTTLLFVSHDIAAIRNLCARTVWIDNGVVREIGETKEVLDAYAVATYAKEQNVENSSNHAINKVRTTSKVTPSQNRDCRLDFINNSNLRNDIEVFEFNQNAVRWGEGLAKVISVTMMDIDGNLLSWIIGGEEVLLTVNSLALQELIGVFVGFMVRDRLGQTLFGDNTYLTTIDSPVTIKANHEFKTSFRFLMPILPQGTYAVTAAIAVGTQQDHVVHEWISEALFFESHNAYSVSGLVGVPMHSIEIIYNS